MSTVAALPTSGDQSSWTDSERALVEAAGLVYSERRNGPKQLADRPTVEAFLLHCRRTGLDPIARQIYAIRRAGKWQTQVSIDGARLVAERTGEYEGQTDPEWSNDGVAWSIAWKATPEHPHPEFARVGVYRRGHRDAMRVVARWESYAVYEDVWSNGQKTGEQKVGSMWGKMPDLMLAKVAEMLALRKAFPQDLSGLYSSEEMDQASSSTPPAKAPQQRTVQQSEDAAPTLVDVEPEAVTRAAQQFLEAGRSATSKDQVRALYKQARSDGVLTKDLADALQQLAASIPEEPAPAEEWAPKGEPANEWPVAPIPADDAEPAVEGEVES